MRFSTDFIVDIFFQRKKSTKFNGMEDYPFVCWEAGIQINAT